MDFLLILRIELKLSMHNIDAFFQRHSSWTRSQHSMLSPIWVRMLWSNLSFDKKEMVSKQMPQGRIQFRRKNWTHYSSSFAFSLYGSKIAHVVRHHLLLRCHTTVFSSNSRRIMRVRQCVVLLFTNHQNNPGPNKCDNVECKIAQWKRNFFQTTSVGLFSPRFPKRGR